MKKFVLSILLSALCVTAFAETEMRMRNLENRMNKVERDSKTLHPQYDPITPNAGPKVYDGMDMFLSLDFIYWTGRLDSLVYSQSGVGNLSDLRNPSKGHANSVDWSWDPGFKLGYGWTFCHGGWDLYLQYTWFYSNVGDSKHSHSLQPTFTIFPPYLENVSNLIPIRMRSGHAHWDLHYQVGDLELGRNYYINRYLKLRPFVGFKGTWQKQDYNVFFETHPLQFGNVQAAFDYQMRQDHMIWGIGLRTGLNTSWQFTKWLSLYGDFALTGMWIHYDLDRKDTYSVVESNPTLELTTANIEDTLRVIKPVLELGVGLRIETYFHCNRLHARLQAGWETHIWPNQTTYLNLGEQSDRYDLSLQGLTVKFRFDF